MTDRDSYNKIFENGCNHLTAADVLAQNEHFGFAISHIILGIEELIKYQVVQYVSKDDGNFKTEIKKVYERHTTKHNLLKEFIASITSDFYEDGVEVFYKIIVQEDFSGDLEKVYNNRFRQLGMYLNVGFKDLNIVDKELENLIKWLEAANTLKNDGFYVDCQNNLVKKPNDLNLDDFAKAQRFGDIILKYTTVVKDLDMTEEEFIDFLNKKI